MEEKLTEILSLLKNINGEVVKLSRNQILLQESLSSHSDRLHVIENRIALIEKSLQQQRSSKPTPPFDLPVIDPE